MSQGFANQIINVSVGASVQPGTNITTGGTVGNQTVNTVASPFFTNINASGVSSGNMAVFTTLTGGTVSGGTFYSGSTPLSSIITLLSPPVSAGFSGWTASTGINSLIANNGTNSASGISASVLAGTGNTVGGRNSSIGAGGSLTNIFDDTFLAKNITGATISGGTFFSGSTPLSQIITLLSPPVSAGFSGWTASTGVNSLKANNGTNTASGVASSVLGGTINGAIGDFSSVMGGQNNSATTAYSSVAGGLTNKASGKYSFVGGGRGNYISGFTSFNSMIGNGYYNSITSAAHSAVVAGKSHIVSGTYALIGTGVNNKITANYSTILNGGGNKIYSLSSAILGGGGHLIGAYSPATTIIGGTFNSAQTSYFSSIKGGFRNNITSSNYSTIGNGKSNNVSGTSHYSTILNGSGNTISASNSTILAGISNWITVNATGSTIGAGSFITNFERDTFMAQHICAISRLSGSTIIGGTGSFTNLTANTLSFNPAITAVTTSTFNVDLSLSSVFIITLSANTTISYTNAKIGTYNFIITQDATGGRTLAYSQAAGSTFASTSGNTITLSTGANQIDLLSGIYNGSKMLIVDAKNFTNL